MEKRSSSNSWTNMIKRLYILFGILTFMVATPVFADSILTSHYGCSQISGLNSGGLQKMATEFIAPSSDPLNKINFVDSYTSGTGNIYANLYSETSDTPNAVLAVSDPVDITTLPGSIATTTYTFSTPYTLVSGTKYFVEIDYVSTGAFAICTDSTSPAIFAYDTGGGWNTLTNLYSMEYETITAPVPPPPPATTTPEATSTIEQTQNNIAFDIFCFMFGLCFVIYSFK